MNRPLPLLETVKDLFDANPGVLAPYVHNWVSVPGCHDQSREGPQSNPMQGIYVFQ